ncbi:MAG: hypothetical protein AABY22_25100 [Nanoarchaeota archaeon]
MRKTIINPIKQRLEFLSKTKLTVTNKILLEIADSEIKGIITTLKVLQQLIPTKAYYYRLPKILKECLEENGMENRR